MTMPKVLNPPKLPFKTPAQSVGSDDVSKDLERMQRLVLEQTGWQLLSHLDQGTAWQWIIGAGESVHRKERLERLNALIQSEAPARVLRWDLQFVERGLAIDAVSIDRQAWITVQTQNPPLSLRSEPMLAYAPSQAQLESLTIAKTDPLKVSSGPNYSHVLGGPDAFVLYRLGFDVSAQYAMNANSWLEGTLDFRVLDNYQVFKFTGPSNLPRVRTYAREYATTSRVTMPILQATHVESPAPDHYASAYAGYLESMYAGVGAEWLYRPWRSPIAVGVDAISIKALGFGLTACRRGI
jgi:hypothetical protein